MVSLKTAIEELNNGVVEFAYPKDGGCTTEGEVVIYLKRLEEFEKTGLEPQQIEDIAKAMSILFDGMVSLHKSELDFLDAGEQAKKEYFCNLAKEIVQANRP